MSKSFKKVFFILFAIAVTCGLASFGISRFSSSAASFPRDFLKGLDGPSEKLYHVHTSQDFDASTITQLEIKTTAADVTFVKGKGNKIEIELDGMMPGENNPGLRTQQSHGSLTVETLEGNKESHGLSFNFDVVDDDSRKMIVRLPQSAGKTLSVTTVSGDVSADDPVVLSNLNVTTVSGNIEIGDAHVQNLHSKTVSGDLNFEGEAKKSQAASVSGNIELNYGNKVEALDLESVSGDIQLNLDKSQGAIVDVTTLSGDIHTDSHLEVTEKPARKYAHGKLGDGSATILVHTISGDFHLDVED